MINNNSIYSSNIIEEDYSNEIGTTEKKKNKEKNNEIINDVNNEINIKDIKIEKEPQDNCKKKIIKNELPKDTDEPNYKESLIQYDNISSISKNNKNSISLNESKNISNKDNNNSKNNTNKKSKNINKRIDKQNSIKDIKNNNNEEISNSINNSINISINNYNNNSKNKKNEIKNIIGISSPVKVNNNNNLNNSYNESENINLSSIENENYSNYLDKETGINKNIWKKNKNIYKEEYSKTQSLLNSQIYKTIQQNNNIDKDPEKEVIQNKIMKKKRPIKVLTFKKNEFNINNINKRSNSSSENRNKYIYNKSRIKSGGERLYEQYMKKLEKKNQFNSRLINERLEEENKEMYFNPKINKNSKIIIERLRSNENGRKVEERLINYGNCLKQKYLLELASNDIRSRTKSPFKPKINRKSSSIAENNKKYRINETKNIIAEKKKRINYNKMNLEKEFGKRNRSIGNEFRKTNNFINFKVYKNNQKIYHNYNNIYKNNNINPFNKADIIDESNYNFNTCKNSKYCNNAINTISDENKNTMSQLNKTLELNTVYKELYNSIDEKNDSDLTKFFCNYTHELNSNLSDNNNFPTKVKTKINQIKNNNIYNGEKRSMTPPAYSNNYSLFDYLYYESEKLDDKKKKKQELNFKRNHPFNPRISKYAKELKHNNRETTKEFVNRISKNLQEIKNMNFSKNPNNNRKNKFKNYEQNNKDSFRPKVSRGPKSLNQRDITTNLKGYYDKRITKEKNDLQKIKKEEENEKKNIYNQKSKDIIMKIKHKKYKEIFNLLDLNQEGFISNNNIQLTNIDETILKDISPILEELNQSKKKMSFKEFCIKIDKIITEKKNSSK